MPDRKAQTLTELLIASVLTVIFFTSAMEIFVLGRNYYATGSAGQNLQRDVNGVIGRIVKGVKENTTKTGLRSAKSFTNPIVLPTSIEFIGSDGATRRYYTGAGGIYYYSSILSPTDKLIYATPANSVLTLQFSEPMDAFGNLLYSGHELISIYLSITQTVSDNKVSGSISTYVNLRNTPK